MLVANWAVFETHFFCDKQLTDVACGTGGRAELRRAGSELQGAELTENQRRAASGRVSVPFTGVFYHVLFLTKTLGFFFTINLLQTFFYKQNTALGEPNREHSVPIASASSFAVLRPSQLKRD